MTVISRDSIYNAIQDGIKEEIRVAIEHKRLRAAVMLINARMDAMAALGMSAGQKEVMRSDFMQWVDKYLRLSSDRRGAGTSMPDPCRWPIRQCGNSRYNAAPYWAAIRSASV
ncbi:MAG: hypothetical protein JNL96_03290 [Planctomycetaceae bacterium]|jgi:hypothetical protein|nr:hypothetical protein [Planctomycetaceae bacterium]